MRRGDGCECSVPRIFSEARRAPSAQTGIFHLAQFGCKNRKGIQTSIAMPWEIEWTVKGPDGPTVEKELVDADGTTGSSAASVLEGLSARADVVSISATRKPAWPALVGDAPTPGIADQLEQGTVVPFLGAGASYCARASGQNWTAGSSFPPSGKELADYLARKSNFPGTYPHDWSDLSQIASFYSLRLGRGNLDRRLRDIFLPPEMKNFDPAAVAAKGGVGGGNGDAIPALPLTPHRVLAKVKKPMLIVTTNYDMLMEQALLESGQTDFDIVVPSTKRSAANAMFVQRGFGTAPVVAKNELDFRGMIDLTKRTVIFKMHGSVFPDPAFDSFIITEDDYVSFLSRMTATSKIIPAILEDHFRGRSFLFLGYGLRDWNLRLLLQNLRTVLPTQPAPDSDDEQPEHWAIQYFPTQSDTALWQRRRVNIFHRDLRDFVESLDKELGAGK